MCKSICSSIKCYIFVVCDLNQYMIKNYLPIYHPDSGSSCVDKSLNYTRLNHLRLNYLRLIYAQFLTSFLTAIFIFLSTWLLFIMAKSQSQIQEKQWLHTQENHGNQAIQYRKQNKRKTNQ